MKLKIISVITVFFFTISIVPAGALAKDFSGRQDNPQTSHLALASQNNPALSPPEKVKAYAIDVAFRGIFTSYFTGQNKDSTPRAIQLADGDFMVFSFENNKLLIEILDPKVDNTKIKAAKLIAPGRKFDPVTEDIPTIVRSYLLEEEVSQKVGDMFEKILFERGRDLEWLVDLMKQFENLPFLFQIALIRFVLKHQDTLKTHSGFLGNLRDASVNFMYILSSEEGRQNLRLFDNLDKETIKQIAGNIKTSRVKIIFLQWLPNNKKGMLEGMIQEDLRDMGTGKTRDMTATEGGESILAGVFITEVSKNGKGKITKINDEELEQLLENRGKELFPAASGKEGQFTSILVSTKESVKELLDDEILSAYREGSLRRAYSAISANYSQEHPYNIFLDRLRDRTFEMAIDKRLQAVLLWLRLRFENLDAEKAEKLAKHIETQPRLGLTRKLAIILNPDRSFRVPKVSNAERTVARETYLKTLLDMPNNGKTPGEIEKRDRLNGEILSDIIQSFASENIRLDPEAFSTLVASMMELYDHLQEISNRVRKEGQEKLVLVIAQHLQVEVLIRVFVNAVKWEGKDIESVKNDVIGRMNMIPANARKWRIWSPHEQNPGLIKNYAALLTEFDPSLPVGKYEPPVPNPVRSALPHARLLQRKPIESRLLMGAAAGNVGKPTGLDGKILKGPFKVEVDRDDEYVRFTHEASGAFFGIRKAGEVDVGKFKETFDLERLFLREKDRSFIWSNTLTFSEEAVIKDFIDVVKGLSKVVLLEDSEDILMYYAKGTLYINKRIYEEKDAVSAMGIVHDMMIETGLLGAMEGRIPDNENIPEEFSGKSFEDFGDIVSFHTRGRGPGEKVEIAHAALKGDLDKKSMAGGKEVLDMIRNRTGEYFEELQKRMDRELEKGEKVWMLYNIATWSEREEKAGPLPSEAVLYGIQAHLSRNHDMQFTSRVKEIIEHARRNVRNRILIPAYNAGIATAQEGEGRKLAKKFTARGITTELGHYDMRRSLKNQLENELPELTSMKHLDMLNVYCITREDKDVVEAFKKEHEGKYPEAVARIFITDDAQAETPAGLPRNTYVHETKVIAVVSMLLDDRRMVLDFKADPKDLIEQRERIISVLGRGKEIEGIKDRNVLAKKLDDIMNKLSLGLEPIRMIEISKTMQEAMRSIIEVGQAL